jgi:uncharacterized zinc-type alcohol dehydrogenase-like protein
MTISCWAAMAARQKLQQFSYAPAELGRFDVEIAITHCGLCHSDINMIDNDWAMSAYPLVAGHEIVGTIRAAGPGVPQSRIGERAGVGWQCGSCLDCEWCRRGMETSCSGIQGTCVQRPGGFADAIRVDSRFAFPIPDGLSSAAAAPLLCGGITVYTPLRRDALPGSRVGIIGIGGLGHLAIRFARAFGCEVTAFSTTPAKEEETRRLGAHHFVTSSEAAQMARCANSLDLLISTVTVDLDWPVWMSLLRPRGVLTLVGASPGMLSVPAMQLIMGQKSVRGSVIGDCHGIEEMLRFAALHGITAQAEVMPMAEVNAAIDRVRRNQARYRVVLENN